MPNVASSPRYHLTRSHGLGNDYLVADPGDLPFELTPARVRLICDRHVGVGSDGILVLSPPHGPSEFGLRILNPDGSEAEKSGNGIRIFSKWLWDTGRAQSRDLQVITPGGTVPASLQVVGGRARFVTAQMGRPTFRDDLPTLEVLGETLEVSALSIGNPHCVVLRDELDITDLHRLGPAIENHPAFPNRTNVQLAHPIARNRVEALIWERGAGETQASGSSSCAIAAACHRAGLVDDSVTVAMPGGDLEIRIAHDGQVWMHGPAEEIALVTLSPDLLARLAAFN